MVTQQNKERNSIPKKNKIMYKYKIIYTHMKKHVPVQLEKIAQANIKKGVRM